MLGGEIKVVLSLDNNQFVVQTQKAGVTIQELQRAIDRTSRSTEALEQHFTGAMGKFRSVVQVASMLRYAMHDVHDIFAALPGAILKTSGEVEKMTKLMEGMSKQTTQAAREAEALNNVKFVFNMAQRAPFDVKTLTDSFVKLKSGGLDPTDGSMKALVDSVAKFGGTSDTMHRASIAIQQMAGKGVISMEELRQQLGEAVPNAINMMAQGAGMSIPKFAKLVQTGTVEATTALRNMFTVMRFENDGAADAMMNSWTGMLALLKTKFELFKLEAGKNDFFKEAKNQLQDLIGLFDTGSAKRFANDIGNGLADIVRLLSAVVKMAAEWSDTIKLAGQAFIAYFAATKVQSLAAALRKLIDGQIGKYKEDVQAKRDALTNKQTLIANEIAEEQRAFSVKHAAIEKRVAAEQAADQKLAADQIKSAERQRAALAKELADRVAHYQSLNALQQQFLGQQMAAELAAETAMRQKKAGSSATARGYTAEADRLGANAAMNAGSIAAVNAEIAAIKAKDAALLQSIQTTRNATTANNHQAESAALAAQHARLMAGLLDQKAAAATRAATGVGIMSKAMSGAGVIFNAFGGWVGIAIGVLVTLGQKLWEYMNRWKEFDEVVKRTKAGIASEDDLKKAQAAANEAAKSMNALSTVIRQLDQDGETNMRSRMRAKNAGFIAKDGFGDVAAYRASLETKLAEETAIFKNAVERSGEQKRLLNDERVGLEMSQFERTYRRGLEAKIDTLRNQSAELAEAERKELDKARKDAAANGTKLTQSQEEAISARYAAQKNKLVVESERYKLQVAQTRRDELQAMLAVEKDDKKKDVLNSQLKFVRDQLDAATAGLKQAESLGSVPTAAKDPKAKLKEAPIVRMAERLEAEVAVAKAKLAAILADAKTIDSMRQQVMFDALGDMAEGKFDTMSEDKDGNKVANYMGGIDARKNYVKALSDYLAKGNTDLTAFVNGLDQLKNKTQFLEVFQAMVDKRQINDSIAALNSIKQIGVDTADEMKRATTEFNNEGLVKENSYLDETQKRLDKLALTVTKNTEGYAEFIRMRDQSLMNANTVDVAKMGTEAAKATRDADLYAKKAILNQADLKKFEHQEELNRIDAMQKRREKDTQDMMSKGVLDQYEFQAKMTAIAEHGNALRAASAKRLATDLMTPLQKLAVTWQDSTTAMKQATASWASDFMDRLTNVIAGGAFKWKEFAAGMAKDMLSIVVKKSLGDMVTGAFGSFGDKMSGYLGLSGGSDTKGTFANPMITKDVNDKTGVDMFAEAKEKLNSTWDSLKDKLSGAWDSIKDNMSRVMEGLKSGLDWLMQSLSSAFSDSGGGGLGGMIGSLFGGGQAAGAGATEMSQFDYAAISGFANGGIMTSSGSLGLHKYATGGVANSPQVALFGEGSTPEAYVPLPDGRSIPVTMTGSGNTTTTNGVVINIVVNQDGSQSDTTSGDDAKVWQAMAQKVRGVVIDEMGNQQRPGGMLYNR